MKVSKAIETISESTRWSKEKRNPLNQIFWGKSKLQTGNEFLKFTFEVEINISLYTLSPNLSVCYIDRWKLLATHNLSYGFMFKQKSIFLLLFSLLEILHLGWEASVVNSWKKMRDYKVMISMRKPIVSRRRNLVWRWDWKKKTSLPFWVKRSADNLLTSFF